MPEKKRGLGRGLGALIPQTVSEQRPVDVFFPNSGDEDRGSGAKTTDPAASMRTAARAKSVSRETGVRKTASSAAARKGAEDGNAAPTGARKTTRAKAKRPAVEPESTASRPTSGESTSLDEQTPDTDVSRETLAPVDGAAFGEIPLGEIAVNPQQPRQVFDEDALDELVMSITQVGVLQPVVVRLVSDTSPRYQLIMGERRFRASGLAGLEVIPAIIRATDDEDLLRDALLENLHRVDLNPLEEAAAYEQLLRDFGCTQEELSARIGRSRPQISNTLRLLKLPPLVQRRVAAGVISAGHARALLTLVNAGHMEELAQRIVAEGLSVRAAEEAAIFLNSGDPDRPSRTRSVREVDPELAALAASIGDRLDTKVSIAMGRNKGKISVEFAGQDDLTRILEALKLRD